MPHAYLNAAKDLAGNPGQWAAYESKGNCVVLAGPGSGKTKTLTTKLARMIAEDVNEPRGIACITYSNECASELKARLDRLGIKETRATFVGTVHSFCFTQLVLPFASISGIRIPDSPQVASISRQSELFANALADTAGVDENPSSWRFKMDNYRRVNLNREILQDGDDVLLALTERYEQELHDHNFIDFDQIVLMGLSLVENNEWVRRCIKARFPIIVVDEYQDLGGALHRIVNALREGGIRFFIVGDPDQSIYGFSGAQPQLLEDLANADGIEAVRLRFNYRSGSLIVNAARQFIGEGRDYESFQEFAGTIDFHHCKRGLSHQAEYICSELIPGIQERLGGISLGEIAVLFRTKNEGDVIAAAATKLEVPFVRFDKGAPFEKTPLTRWIMSCAQWAAGGWRTGEPRISQILADWRKFNRSRSEDQLLSSRRGLVSFLFGNREPDCLLGEWLERFNAACIQEFFTNEPMMEDEIEAFANLQHVASNAEGMGRITVAVFGRQTGASDYLNLTTLHSAKGLEWKAVIMFGMDQGILPWYNEPEDRKREARRLFYVGITRAMKEVHLTWSGWVQTRFGPKKNGASEFIREVYQRLKES